MIRLQAPAKVNYFLEITGKRPDGYHALSILFQTLSLADQLTFRPGPALVLSCSDPRLPTDERNLVLRAARRLQEILGERRGARIHLQKRVPMGAGLGGGSSDASAALTGLCRLWGRRLPPGAMHRLARQLGADVPFFLQGGLCAATGIGDRLRPLPPSRRLWMVLVYPGFGVSTAEAYARVRLPFPRRRSISPVLQALHRREYGRLPLFNRFEELVFPLHPRLVELKRRLSEGGRWPALMSGSGSSLFAIVSSPAQGRRLLSLLKPQYPQSWLVHTV